MNEPTSENREPPPLLALFTRLARELGGEVYGEEPYGYAGYIAFPNGRRAFFKAGALDVNPHGAAELVRDKSYGAALLRHFGFSVPEDVLLASPRYRAEVRLKNLRVEASLGGIERALGFAEARGFPLYVKPNEGYGGHGVSKAWNAGQLREDLSELFRHHLRVLVQTAAEGRDFRLLVAGGEVALAYERVPFRVAGDGARSIAELARARIARLAAGWPGGKVDLSDRRIARQLAAAGLGLDDVPELGRRVDLLPVANLSAGGEAVDRSDEVSPRFTALALRACRVFGLGFAAVDLMTEDIAAEDAPYTIIEINAAPGLTNYAALGVPAAARVERAYRRLFRTLAGR